MPCLYPNSTLHSMFFYSLSTVTSKISAKTQLSHLYQNTLAMPPSKYEYKQFQIQPNTQIPSSLYLNNQRPKILPFHFPKLYFFSSPLYPIHAVEHFVQAPPYNPKGCGFDPRWCHWHWHNPSGSTMVLGLTRPLTGMSTRNISGGKGGRYLGLTTLPSLYSNCLLNLGFKTSWNPQGLSRPVQGLLYVYHKGYRAHFHCYTVR
jgi:hypothetical protein